MLHALPVRLFRSYGYRISSGLAAIVWDLDPRDRYFVLHAAVTRVGLNKISLPSGGLVGYRNGKYEEVCVTLDIPRVVQPRVVANLNADTLICLGPRSSLLCLPTY